MEKNRGNLLKGYNLLLYFAGSMIMNEPTEECVIDFWANGTLKKLPVKSSNPRFIQASALLRDSCTDKELCRKMLEEDYFRLFNPTGHSLAPACESFYLSDRQKDVMSSENVTDFYNSYGWNSRRHGKMPDDHLGVELLFLTRLVEKYLSLDDEPSCCEMRKEIRRFIDHHILSWIPGWNKDIQKYAHTLSYKGIAALIYACIEDLYGLLDYRSNPL
jgi:TorA maturation chaperone TorD